MGWEIYFPFSSRHNLLTPAPFGHRRTFCTFSYSLHFPKAAIRELVLQVHFRATSRDKTCLSVQVQCSQLVIFNLWRQSLAPVLHTQELWVLNHVGFSFQETNQPLPQQPAVRLNKKKTHTNQTHGFLNALKRYKTRFTNKFQLLCTPLAAQNSCKAGLSAFSQAHGYFASSEYGKVRTLYWIRPVENIILLLHKARGDKIQTYLQPAVHYYSRLNLATGCPEGEGGISILFFSVIYLKNALLTCFFEDTQDNK